MTKQYTEDDTFRKLSRLPFLTVRDQVVNFILGGSSEEAKCFAQSNGWSWDEFLQEDAKHFKLYHD